MNQRKLSWRLPLVGITPNNDPDKKDRTVQLDGNGYTACRGDYVIRLNGSTCLQLWNTSGQVTRLAERLPQHEDELMTIAQQLEQKGIEKGRDEGIQLGEQRGIEKGRHEGKLEVARTMLQNGLDRNTVMKMTGLSEDDLAQIRH